ncbi:MAG: hypothetical protein QME60_07110 [Verrucomicrobiota bacterium]|nr:hypothetical protein [Verrucomicrobiota bacterium]
MQEQKDAPLTGFGVLARLYWLFFGNALLFFLLVFIFEKAASFPSLMDAALWLTAASLLLVRYVDIRYLNGQTGEGKPATMRHWRQHALVVAPLALGGWILAHVSGHFLR